MIQNTLNTEASAAADRYVLLVNGWRGVYSAAFHSSDVSAPRTISEAERQGYGLARTYLAGERAAIASATENIAANARRDALTHLGLGSSATLSERTSELLGASQSYLDTELAVQIERDVAFMKQTLRQAALAIHLEASTRGIPLKTAMVQYRISNSGELRFHFKDRQNRKWPSQKFVRSAWRQHLLGTYNDTYIATAAEHGNSLFQVEHPDAGHSAAGLQFTILNNTALPHYSEIKDKVFHPNSEALVRVATVV